MRDERPNRKECAVWGALVGVAVMLIAAALTSCSPRIVERIEVREKHDTLVVHQVQVDSVFRRDSVFVREKGDTVYVYREHVRDRYKFVHDTTRLVRVDSVAVERVKEVKVEKPLSVGQSLKIRAFWWLFVAALLLALWTFRKSILNIFTK
jgi:hypothetical protein